MLTLVTGATGFLGSVLTRQLLEAGNELRILRRSHSKLDLLGEAAGKVEHVIGDVRDPESLADAMRGASRVYHTAASTDQGPRSVLRRLRHINVRGTAAVVNAALAAGVQRLIHTSSIAALGPCAGHDCTRTEDASWQKSPLNTPYAISKHESELEIHRGIAEGLDAVMVNPSVIFGPGRKGENTMRLAEMLRSGWVKMAPTGGTNVVDVEDVAAGHIKAMERGQTGHRYILGSENLSWRDIFSALATAVGVHPPRRDLPLGLALCGATMAEAWTAITRRPAVMTRVLARNLSKVHRYCNDRAVHELGCTFRPFEVTVLRIAEALRA